MWNRQEEGSKELKTSGRGKEIMGYEVCIFFFSSRRRHTRLVSDWSSDVCSSDLLVPGPLVPGPLSLVPGPLDPGPLSLVPGPWSLVQIGRASCRERV